MLKRLKQICIRVLIYTVILICVGIVVRFFVRESTVTLQDILFWVGAAPLALYSVGLFGSFMGRGDSSYQMARSVTRSSPNQRSLQDRNDHRAKTASSLSWIAAGLLVWLVSYFM